MKKLRDTRGETLIETLCALLIATITLSFLATAILSSGKINAAVRDKAGKNVVSYSTREKQENTLTVTIRGTTSTDSFQVAEYVYENGYRSYSYETEAIP